MTAGWTAGSVRGRLLTSRRLGVAGARTAAAAGSAEAAVRAVAASAYGRDVRPAMAPDAAQRAVSAVCLWHLRVLAGWLPPRAGSAVRVFASTFELDDIADRLAPPDGAPPEPHRLGALAVAGPRLRQVTTPGAVRGVLAASAWGDPGSARWPDAAPALRARWALWLADAVPRFPEWAAGAAALVVAESLATGSPLTGPATADLSRVLGLGWRSAHDLAALRAALGRSATWVLDDGGADVDGWRARARWWRRVEDDAARAVRAARPGPATVAASAALLVADARRVRAALRAAAWGPDALEVFDAVA